MGAVAPKEEEKRTRGRGTTLILSMGCRVMTQAVSRLPPHVTGPHLFPGLSMRDL